MSTLEIVLEDVAGLLDKVGAVFGVTPAGAVLHVTAIVVHGAAGVVHVVEAEELERIRQSAALGTAAGLAAWEASHQVFKR
jgi:hypothetical protein